ncbi:MAG: SUMF1/EgtB/PvdO family nonheme iron enzyme [Anaerolineae bacterium]|nr:SUMF1/EgtB/PvdO family nonheme iron enzyme [Anaerolineae bacterium]
MRERKLHISVWMLISCCFTFVVAGCLNTSPVTPTPDDPDRQLIHAISIRYEDLPPHWPNYKHSEVLRTSDARIGEDIWFNHRTPDKNLERGVVSQETWVYSDEETAYTQYPIYVRDNIVPDVENEWGERNWQSIEVLGFEPQADEMTVACIWGQVDEIPQHTCHTVSRYGRMIVIIRGYLPENVWFATADYLKVVQAVDQRAADVIQNTAPPGPATPWARGDTQIRFADGMPMVYVPGGRFQMGSTRADADYALALCCAYVGPEYVQNCTPNLFAHEQFIQFTTVDSFWMDRTEVTTAQFASFLNAYGASDDFPAWVDLESAYRQIEWRAGQFRALAGYANNPAVKVSWHAASAYCAWAGARLPTEREWEYAARGGDSARFPWGDEFDGTRLNYCDANCAESWADSAVNDGYVYTAPVGSYPAGASWCGALDLAGNVWEWLADTYQGTYVLSPYYRPTTRFSGATRRLLRGGSWYDPPNITRSTTRRAWLPENRKGDVGFRCVQSAVP